LKAELLAAEAAHFSKARGVGNAAKNDNETMASAPKRQLESRPEDDADEDMEAKRRRILEETRDIDADSDAGSDEDSTEDDRLVIKRVTDQMRN
jgi:protein CWC15